MATHSVCLPGKFHEQRNLGCYSPWSHKELNTAEWLTSWCTVLNPKARRLNPPDLRLEAGQVATAMRDSEGGSCKSSKITHQAMSNNHRGPWFSTPADTRITRKAWKLIQCHPLPILSFKFTRREPLAHIMLSAAAQKLDAYKPPFKQRLASELDSFSKWIQLYIDLPRGKLFWAVISHLHVSTILSSKWNFLWGQKCSIYNVLFCSGLVATCGWWALEMGLGKLSNWIFNVILTSLNSNMWSMAPLLTGQYSSSMND